MEKLTLKEFVEQLDTFLSPDKPREIYIQYEQTEINYGIENDCDLEWCKEHNIPAYFIGREDGCCVNAAGNINILDVRHQPSTWYCTVLMNSLVQFLKTKGLNAVLEGNDMMLDGYKVASITAINLAPTYEWQYTGMQISVNQDLYVMEHACKNPTKKTPKGLSEWGITTEDILEWVETL